MKEEQKVWIRGVEGRGEEVIKMLEDRGGKNVDGMEGEDPYTLYYINHFGNIYFIEDYDEMANIIMDYYKEIKLPEQCEHQERWKDGDVLYSEKDGLFSVFDGSVCMNDNGFQSTGAYFGVTENGFCTRGNFGGKGCPHLATPSEVEHFHEILHKYGKEWDAEKKQFVEWRWKPKEGDTYYYVDGCTLVEDRTFEGRVFDERHYEVGNCFRTREEAEAMAEKIKKLLKGGRNED